MPKTVRILGTAWNLLDMPLPHPPDIEVWMCNDPRSYRKYLSNAVINHGFTRWFNLHSRAHMEATYPRGVATYKTWDGSRPLYTQKAQSDLPGCVPFPREAIQTYFDTRYFSCSITWLLAFAALEGFTHIDLQGFALGDRKPNNAYIYERPCFFYWIQKLRSMGIDITYPEAVSKLPFEPGDPATYTGPLYGYDTKSEMGWNPVTKIFDS